MANYEPEQTVEIAEPNEQQQVAPAPAPDRTDREDARPAIVKSIVREYFESIVVTFIMAIFGMTFITQAVKVPTGSMLNTILVEDHLMVNKFLFGAHPAWLDHILPYRDIRRGDIIVFKYPLKPEENYVKRVIGLPGDKIQVRGTRVFINGQELPENKIFVSPKADAKADLEPTGPMRPADNAGYTVYYSQTSDFDDAIHEQLSPGGRETYHLGDRGSYGVDQPYTVPEGTYFCMGDNRDNSEDSRFWGTVPRENVIGRAMFVYWSVNESERPDDGSSSLLVDMLKYTRWGRTGTLIK